jgi:hypothetical protein
MTLPTFHRERNPFFASPVLHNLYNLENAAALPPLRECAVTGEGPLGMLSAVATLPTNLFRIASDDGCMGEKFSAQTVFLDRKLSA